MPSNAQIIAFLVIDFLTFSCHFFARHSVRVKGGVPGPLRASRVKGACPAHCVRAIRGKGACVRASRVKGGVPGPPRACQSF